jgi:cell division protein FtsI (penicillin-binding protein 3)
MKKQSAQFTYRGRRNLILIAVAGASLLLVWRAVDLQVVNKSFLQGQGDARYLREVADPAHRGMITDRYGEPLAISTPVDSVWAVPQVLAQARESWSRLAKVLGIKKDVLVRLLASKRDKEFVYLKRRVSPDVAGKVMALKIPGVALAPEYKRFYPAGEVAAHVVGFANVDDVGQEGMELVYNDYLKGVPGVKRVIKDRFGRIVENVERISEPEPGKNITLSIDRRLQYLAYYNPNNRGKLKSDHLRNRAVTDVFEPGSTVKPFTVAAALESGQFKPHTNIDTRPGRFRVGRKTIRDFRDYGVIDVSTVIQKSSNIGASKMALAISPEYLWNAFVSVGLGEVTGSSFPGESAGLLTDYGSWHEIERATVSYGYGLSVTTLQLARAYAALATDGRSMPVSFLRRNRADAEEMASLYTPVFSRKSLSAVRGMLESVVVKGGTGTKAAVPGYRIAGKTGTVKKSKSGGYTEDSYLSLFAGMAPASDPSLVMVVVINEPRGEEYGGGAIAAPVFSRVMAGALRMLDVPPDNLKNPGQQLALLKGAK